MKAGVGSLRVTAGCGLDAQPADSTCNLPFFFFITLGLEMSDTKVYEP